MRDRESTMANSSDPIQPGNVDQAPVPSVERLLAERNQLRDDLHKARTEIIQLQCQAEMLREEWFAARQQQEEYRKYIRKVTGSDPHISAQVIYDMTKNGLTFEQLIKGTGLDDVDGEAGASPDEYRIVSR
jgi:hypothetical protein